MKELKKSGLEFLGVLEGWKRWRGAALFGHGGMAAVAAVSPSPPLSHPFGQKYYQ